MKGELDPQSGHQQREPKLDISPLQIEIHSKIEGVQFQSTFSEQMMIELAFTEGPSTQPAYIEPTYTEIPQPQAPSTPNHAPQMDLSTQISSLGTHMAELAVVNDTRFYFMEDRMNQYQSGFTSQFEYLQQRIDRIEDCMEQRMDCIEDSMVHQHEEILAYLCSLFPPPPPQP